MVAVKLCHNLSKIFLYIFKIMVYKSWKDAIIVLEIARETITK
nr:MAG TPA: hypothetical protein [Caudoviricetes sp.]